MASGQIHQRTHKEVRWVAVIAGILTYSATSEWLPSVMLLFGYWLGLYLDPDLDKKQTTIAENRWKNSYFFFWLLPWVKLYGIVSHYILGGHRSPLTHLPGLSSAIRMVWFGFPIIFVWESLDPIITRNILVGIWLGLSISDSVHVAKDL